MHKSMLLTAARGLFTRKADGVFIAAFLILGFSSTLGGEIITLKTYYPSPYGSYKRMKIAESLTVGEASAPGNVLGSLVISSAGSALQTSVLAPDGKTILADVNGYAAAKDLWLKDAGKWASAGKLEIEVAEGYIFAPNRNVKLETVKGPADAFSTFRNSNLVRPYNITAYNAQSTDGIACNIKKGWIRTACMMANYVMGGSWGEYQISSNNGCETNDFTQAESSPGTNVISLTAVCVRYLIDGKPVIPN
ncbi:MAG: hypothetical protein WCS77_08100 [Elusimicrobiaceae bacterium]